MSITIHFGVDTPEPSSKEKIVIHRQPPVVVVEHPTWTGGTDVRDRSLRLRRTWAIIDKGDES